MSALTIRCFIFLIVAIVSCWTVIASGAGPPSAAPQANEAADVPEDVPPQSPAQEETPGGSAKRQAPEKVDSPSEGANRPVDQVELDQVVSRVVEATNTFRREQGLEPVEPQTELQQAAQKFAEFMSGKDLYGHHADGQTPAQRAKAAGYDYCMVRENIAYRTDTRDNTAKALSETFFSGWKESPEHRQNMLAEHVTDTGVGVATEDGVTFYAVQMFGRPHSASIEVRVRNRSDQAAKLKVESDYGVDSFELPPNTIATFTRCLPTTLALKDSQNEAKASESASFAIVASDENDQLKFERLEDSGAAESDSPPQSQ